MAIRHREGVNFPLPTQARVYGLPPPPGVLKINKAVRFTSLTSSPDLTSSLLCQSLPLENVLLFTSPCDIPPPLSSLPLSRCLALQQQQPKTQTRGSGPGAKWWRSPAWIGMLTLHLSPSAEEHLFDLRCGFVFSSPHLQLPLNHVLPPTPSYPGPSLINCLNLEKDSSGYYCFSIYFLPLSLQSQAAEEELCLA